MDICRDIYSIIRSKLNEILELRSTGTLKADNTFVSEGDLLCESLIFSYLKDNLANYIVISEESNNDISDIDGAEFVVTVDPIEALKTLFLV